LFIWRITRIKLDIVEPGKDLALAEVMDKRSPRLAIAGAVAVKTPQGITTGMTVLFVTNRIMKKFS